MNRLAKKCFLVSAASHLLLLTILFVGPAFFASKTHIDNSQALEFIPSRLLDVMDSMAAGPVTKQAPAPPAAVVEPTPPTPPQPTPPEPTPPPPKVEVTPPSKPVIEEVKPLVKAADVIPVPPQKKEKPKQAKKEQSKKEEFLTAKATPEKAQPDKKKIDVNLKQTVRNQNAPKSTEKAQPDEKALAMAKASAVAKSTAGALNSLRDRLTTGINVEPVGMADVAYASYGQVVIGIYENAWVVPTDLASDEESVQATITIAKDGRVIRARVTQKSSAAKLDRSVQQALDSVKEIAPFPDGAKESERTYTINFKPKARQSRG